MRRKWAFHGTRAELLPQIARHGLTPEPPTRSGGGGWEGGGIFISPSPSAAAAYGGSADIGNAPFAYGVLLRFRWPSGPVEYVGDETGENAFIARKAVAPKQIEVYARGVPYDAELDNLRGPWLPVSEAAKMVGADGYLQLSKPEEELSRLVRSQRYDRSGGYRPLVLPGARELPEHGNWPRKLEPNPARTIDELPEDVRIGVVETFDEDDDRIRTFTVYYADATGHPLPSSRDSIDDEEPEKYLSGVVRTFYRPACDAYEVVYSMAAPGWGPLLYDTAIELASAYGGGLMSDRAAVSDAACRVWTTYRRRPDVAKRPLPSRRACAPKAECSTEVAFTKTPDNVNRLERERKLLYFDDRPPGAAGIIPLPDPEEYEEKEAIMGRPVPLSMVANSLRRRRPR